MFVSEHGIALHPMQGIRASSPTEGMSQGFLELWQEPGVYSRVTAGMAIGTPLCSERSALLSS